MGTGKGVCSCDMYQQTSFLEPVKKSQKQLHTTKSTEKTAD